MIFGMKIIFLDIDGVLNSQKYFSENSDRNDEYYSHNNDLFQRKMLDIDLSKLERLLMIIKETNAKVVITSSWKRLDVFVRIANKLQEMGIPIIGVTVDNGINRGLGIKDYLAKNMVKNYIILDDDTFLDYDEELLNHLVKTSFYEDGLNEELTNIAILKLNNKSYVKKRKVY